MPQTTSAVPPSASAGTEIWAVEEIAHSILFYLDVQSVDVIVNFIQATNELRGYLQDPGLWTELLKVHFGGPRDAALRVESRSTQSRDWERTSRELACVELEEFLQSLDDRKRFDDAVTIVEGDIGRVDNIQNKPLDGIAFPTSSYVMNPHIGAAGVVFRRAGRGLDQFVSEQSFRNGLANGAGWLPAGSAVATPGFDAGVEKLIHCVGPSVGMVDCYDLLAQTYENALNCAVIENLQCIAMVSISTGNLGVPCVEGARVALRALQTFLVTGNWEGKLAVICNDTSVMRAFTDEKVALLKAFNVVPPLPAAESAGRWLS
ncbi:hypothetical protein PC129_g12955 [Phytophthora cactorum]|uniref:Macro domain-containing protein n=1 Tax=Phytophthora cactorum TaxID=29920 RepID=A0A329RMS5_9STRA|nr:hypothetical protein Pcac1_g1440 [Phytophthora cactorum]KAG2808896.1 hypothetical protein PC112_g16748 [Phytophthora cactorum]KAG2810566.1 hypothetical protein PC111_g15607 [Phytophthora cactorum]KAG2850439.1 hypothetical protein PC113_g16790 [Phytophthora cactorum]KAG2888290.1 hypothetical protein PC114_g18470 [Phytophthora cactorum]